MRMSHTGTRLDCQNTSRSPTLALALLLAFSFVGAFAPRTSAQQLLATRALEGHQLAELSLSEGQWLDLSLPDRLLAPLELPLVVDGAVYTLVLEPHSVRAPGFQLMVSVPAGSDKGPGTGVVDPLVAADAPAPRTVRGHVLGLAGSKAGGSLIDGRLSLLLRLEAHGPLWAVQPLKSGGHALYRETSVVDSAGGVCGTFAPHSAASGGKQFGGVDPGTILEEAEIAIDADHEFYLLNGSSMSNVIADIENVVEQIRLIYARDVGITYSISSITVRTTSNDPYTTSNSSMLLDEFKASWNSTMTGVQRDVAHLFTGRPLFGSVIGVAFLGVICSKPQAYGLSESRFTTNLVQRVSLTTHELGHNWNSLHCNGTATNDCAIMCASLGGCTGDLEQFGTDAVAAIFAFRQAAPCLTTVVEPGLPTISSVFPTFGKSAGGGMLELHGADFPALVEPDVTVGGVVVDVLSFSETLVTVALPPGAPGTSVSVSLTDGVTLTEFPNAYRYELGVFPGDRITSQLTQMEVERFFFTGLAGSRFTAALKPSDSTEGLISGMRIIGPREDVLVSVVGGASDKGKPQSIKSFELIASGEYRLEVFAVGITSGGYKLKTKAQPVKSVKGTLTVSAAQPGPTLEFSADAGAELKLASFKSLKAKGDFATVDGEPAALMPTILSLTGPGGPIALGDALVLSPKGTSARVKKVPLPTAGDYTLQFGGVADSVGYGKASAKVKAPKRKPVTYVLSP